jgi:hypothetical protein
MMKRRRRWWLAGAAGVVAAVSLLMVPAFGDGPITAELGTLLLHLDSDGDKVIFDPAATGSNQVQTLTAPNCKLASTGASLVSFEGSATQANKNPFAGMKDHRIGVGQTGEGNGEPCARINKDLGQVLTLSLTGALDGREVSYAEIDLGFKFNGSATLELRHAGALVSTITVPCSGASDCGPDSGASDNERVILWLDPADNPGPGHWQAFQVAGTFDTILIYPSSSVDAAKGVVSLEGGFNGSPAGPLGVSLGTDDTVFEVVEAFDGEIDCTENEILIEGENATFSITRGSDIDGECKGPENGLLFNFEAGTEGNELFVDFIAEPVDADPDTVAQFLEVITWRFDSPPDVPNGDPQHRTLSYDDHVGDGKRVMPWCLSDPRDGAGDLPVGTVSAPVDPSAYLPAGHTSCLIESASRVTGLADILSHPLGTFIKVDVVYNIGDGKRYT